MRGRSVGAALVRDSRPSPQPASETAAAACIIYCYFCFVYLLFIIYIAPPAGANLFLKQGASAREEGGEGREIVAAKSTRQRSVLFYYCCYILLGRETRETFAAAFRFLLLWFYLFINLFIYIALPMSASQTRAQRIPRGGNCGGL